MYLGITNVLHGFIFKEINVLKGKKRFLDVINVFCCFWNRVRAQMCNFSILKLVCLHFCCDHFLDNGVPLYVSMPRRLNLRKTKAECLLEAIFLENWKSKGTLGIRHQKQSFKREMNINFFQQLCMKEVGNILSKRGIKIMYF